MLKICDGKGFQMVFENGWTVSVQFGYGNYSENYNMSDFVDRFDFAARNIEAGKRGSNTAEVAAWDKDGEWYKFGSDEYADTVQGYISADEVADFITLIKGK